MKTCRFHPKYKVMRKPLDCSVCWGLWLAKQKKIQAATDRKRKRWEKNQLGAMPGL